MKACRLSASLGVVYEREHLVQVYGGDDVLIGNLKSFIGAGIQAGDSGLVIATPQHRDQLDAALTAAGLPCSTSGGYRYLDAEATMARFMTGEQINRDQFYRVAKEQLVPATAGGRSVRAFGEMVSLLWQQGNQAGALRLEQLWNEIAGDYPLTLFCGYAASDFSGASQPQAGHPVMQLHTSAILGQAVTA